MDPIAIAAIALSWSAGLLGATFVTIGTIEMVTRRPIINIQRRNWTSGEVLAIGLIRVVQGLIFGIYGLVGAIVTTGSVRLPWTGTPWGILVSGSFWLILMSTLIALMVIESHHGRAPSAKGPAAR